jgi:hypothetical protein
MFKCIYMGVEACYVFLQVPHKQRLLTISRVLIAIFTLEVVVFLFVCASRPIFDLWSLVGVYELYGIICTLTPLVILWPPLWSVSTVYPADLIMSDFA